MRKLIGSLSPFTPYQTFFLYEEGKQMFEKHFSLDEIESIQFCHFLEENQIQSVHITGNHSFIVKIISTIEENKKNLDLPGDFEIVIF